MRTADKHILSTRPVTASLQALANSKGVQLDALPFIETELIDTIDVQQEIEQTALQYATIAFTSMNGVDAVTYLLNGQIPDWNIYCIGHATRQQVEAYFGEQSISGTADDAAGLAELIIEEEATDEVIFFCGNQRRDELPLALRGAGIDVQEIIVYQTRELQHRVDKIYDAILFFSPSAVNSFFRQNTLPAQTIVFAIGSSTANAVRRYCSNTIITAASPSKKELIEQAIAYF
ncbi:uroporphyrinogen-III synthase [Sediminibacterium ginsengisoli]|uniref:uroporphyrinogen-III synthase n=1 Tax=Sediminibacterium ginsengisoli TaxID=413434 RepID=UPI00099CD39A|nr:uroporphyrinogen-III synthase [Sediminibacterium ginsengisoli]